MASLWGQELLRQTNRQTTTTTTTDSVPLLFCSVIDLTGGQDGSVAVREWNIDSPVSIARESGTYAKVRPFQLISFYILQLISLYILQLISFHVLQVTIVARPRFSYFLCYSMCFSSLFCLTYKVCGVCRLVLLCIAAYNGRLVFILFVY